MKNLLPLLLCFALSLLGCQPNQDITIPNDTTPFLETSVETIETTTTALPENENNSDYNPISLLPTIPAYTGNPYVIINNNVPFFKESDKTLTPFEIYSDLDNLGRCGTAYANICIELMPTKERESIGEVKPSGWHTVNYHELIDGNYLYNRCHLIGYQLAGENANEKNLITGTRYLNVDGMLPFENQIADYVKSTKNHVLYRVTPLFNGNNLVCDGVLMEAQSIENDNCTFCIYCYNVQPGFTIDYATGDNWITETHDETYTTTEPVTITYILNTNSKKIHKPTCESVNDMSPKNKQETNLSQEELISQGYTPCKICNP